MLPQSSPNRRDFHRYTLTALAAAGLAGCNERDSTFTRVESFASPSAPGDDRLQRLLRGISFGPLPTELRRARELGYPVWLEEQLQPASIEEDPRLMRKLASLETLGLAAADLREYEISDEDTVIRPVMLKIAGLYSGDSPQPTQLAQKQLQQATLLRAVYSRCQLFEVVVDFWNNHFSIDQSKGDCRWLATINDRVIRAHALGRFRDLLRAVVSSPAILFFLDNSKNRAAVPNSPVGINENFARELLELHTVGVAGGYTLRDIQEVARCFTGWTMRDETQLWNGEFLFDESIHDQGEKVVMGLRIPAGGGARDGNLLIDFLAAHPATATFVATKLCRHFVSDNPPPALIEQAAQEFRSHDGDIATVLRVILTSQDYAERREAKFKRPLDYIASALRLLHAETSGEALLPYLETLGQPLFHWPLPDGFPEQAERWWSGLFARWNFAIELLHGKIAGTTVPANELLQATGETQPRELVSALAERLLGIEADNAWLGELAALAPTTGAVPAATAQEWLALLISCPEFQWH
jgi:uncharacterized protein (DUF1800 family)